jgi:hypothetical protein
MIIKEIFNSAKKKNEEKYSIFYHISHPELQNDQIHEGVWRIGGDLL